MAGSEVIDGATILARSLKDQGVEYVFGIVGIPVVETAVALQQHGIKFIAMRNEQAMSYAAQGLAYLTGKPGCCLVVSGPGVIHALAGLANAQSNAWPMLLMAGASDRPQEGLGAFQECLQVEATRQFTKFAARPPTLESIPGFVKSALKYASYGRPGATYLDLPGDLLNAATTNDEVKFSEMLPSPPKPKANSKSIQKALELLKKAKNPLVIIGKGASFARAEKNIRKFIDTTSLPFLPTPMGKGLVPDTHSLCVSSARSLALQKADIVILLGARLNWILHFGRSPRFSNYVKFCQVDIAPEEFHTSVPIEVPILGDVDVVVGQMNEALVSFPVKYSANSPWWKLLRSKMEENRKNVQAMIQTTSVPLNYYAVLNAVNENIPKNSIIVNEGANTMDIGRTMLLNDLPRHRLDAGTFGTMGVGLPFAIAAAIHCQDEGKGKRVICVQGDSAFGFGAMEIETAFRYKLPIIIIIVNNNGIYGGMDEEVWNSVQEDRHQIHLTTPANCLVPNCHYEKMMAISGGQGFFCQTIEELKTAVGKALEEKEKPSIINVMIDPVSQRKQQEFDWLTRAKL